MISQWYRIFFYFVVFILLQVLVANNIHLFGYATPFVYLCAIFKLPFDMSRSKVISLSFFLGLLIDIFSNTFGIHAAACSFMGLMRMPVMKGFVDVREIPEGSIPSFRLFGYGRYIRYILLLVAIHHIALFLIESFGFFRPALMLIRMFSSILFTSILLLVIESFNLSNAKSG
ncbi:MAG: rod shape-determining protein MreD [Tannerella sp.]|jgi:rod shape-determining protein MreD|nr:rod shape-determining protein MreD [Tannerella sp.]